ncbi:MAG TPA: PD-(D/E)XK nuclease family protein [Thermoanaerobaculia bacterium]|nr:PD-(D/E)XK nuclease family protein [Thermoanaerobaculia bacterium]
MTPPLHRLVLSAAAAKRHELARVWLAERRSERAVLLAPSRGAGDDFVHRLVSGGAAQRGLFGVERLTLDLLAGRLVAHSLAAAERAPISALGAEALAALVTDRCLADGELARLAPVADAPRFPRALRQTVSELRLAGVEPEALRRLQGAGADVARLLERYGEELAARGLADRADRLREAAASLAGGAPGWRQRPSLWLDVSPAGRIEERLLEALAAAGGAVLWTLPSQDTRAVAVAREVLGVEPEDLDTDAPADRLERVQRWIFQREGASWPEEEEEEPAPELVFFSAAGEAMECVEVARRIRDLAAAGVPFDEMAIALRQPTAYLPLVEDALRRAGIDGHFARGTARPHPAGRAFLSLLACALEGLSASRFAEYLSLGQVPPLAPDASPQPRPVPFVEPEGDQYLLFGPEPAAGDVEAGAEVGDFDGDEGPAPAGTLVTPMHWERLLVDAAVVGGADRWRRRLLGLEAEFQRRMREVGDEEPARRAAIERDLGRLRRLRGFALPVVETLGALPAGARWGHWLERLRALAVLVLRRPESVLTVLADLHPMAEVGPVTLGQVHQVLAERLGFLQERPSGRRHGKVFVGTIPELVGRSFEVVFVPALAEGIFPRPSSEDPLLLDRARAELAAGLVDRDERLRRERMLLRVAVGAARSRLVVSYPRVDVAQGRSRVPSFYALDVLRAADGRVPALGDLAKRAARASASRMGWPAPADPEEAIDAAEYDLALLRPLLGPGAEEGSGRGRFLLKTNRNLARSLRARARRWRSRWTYADGLVLADQRHYEPAARAGVETAELLAGERLDARPYSPTALQNYAICPYRFLLQAVHRLRPRLDVAGFEQLDPLTRGSIFHQMQFELSSALREADLLPVVPERIGEILDRADEVIERVAAQVEEELAPAIPRVWKGELDSLRNDLRGWLHRVAEEGAGWRPLHFELAFGLPPGADRDPASREEPVTVLGRARLRGAIDLVEIDGAGERLRVVDHKTGRAREERDLVVGGGEVLQPLLYALAAEQILGEGGRLQVVAGRLFYCTLRGGYRILEVPLDLRGRNAIGDVLEVVDGAFAAGFFPAAPREGACRWCDFRPVCGPHEELRVRRKEKVSLEALDELRRTR